MFVWDFDALFAVCLIFLVGLVLVLWIRYNLIRDELNAQTSFSEYLKYCKYCAYVYFDYKKKMSKRCPRCQSFGE